MVNLVTYRGTVYPWHCDHMGHMNVMWYASKFDEATWSLVSLAGITRTYLREARRSMAAVQQNTTYRRELFAGDVVTIRSGVLEVREKVIRIVHEMIDDGSGEIAAFTELTGVHMDQATRRPCALPKPILAGVQGMIVAWQAPEAVRAASNEPVHA
ncbi:MAG: thioesterase family protein [Proteobacteria bacterium]|nr:thioesterase family protein [Pseudomonadota bacterium]